MGTVTTVQLTKTEAAVFDDADKQLEILEKAYATVPDCSNKDGYDLSKDGAKKFTTLRNRISKRAAEMRKPLNDKAKLIKSKADAIEARIRAIETPLAEAYKAIDKAEADKKARFEADMQAKIDYLAGFPGRAANKSPEEIDELINECGQVDTSHGFYHRENEAYGIRQQSIDTLSVMLSGALLAKAEREEQAEKDRELEELRAFKAQKEVEASKATVAPNATPVRTFDTASGKDETITIRVDHEVLAFEDYADRFIGACIRDTPEPKTPEGVTLVMEITEALEAIQQRVEEFAIIRAAQQPKQERVA